MYKVVSTINSIPYPTNSLRFRYKEPNNIEWFKRPEDTSRIIGFTFEEATFFKTFLEKYCQDNFRNSIVSTTNEDELPPLGKYTEHDTHLPILYPFETILNFIEYNGNRFNYEVFGYNRFLVKA